MDSCLFGSLRSAFLSRRLLFGTCLLLISPWGCFHPATHKPAKVHVQFSDIFLPPQHMSDTSEMGASQTASGVLTLEEAVQEALAASPQLEQMQRRMEAALEQVRQVESTFFPRVMLTEEFNATDNPVYALMHIINQRRLEPMVNFNDPGRQQNYATRLQAQWSLFEGGSRWYDRAAAAHMHQAADAERMAAQNRLVAAVAETYYRWLQALSHIGVAEEGLESARTDERLGEARYQAEMAVRSDIARLKARTAEMEGQLMTAKINARRLQAALERLLARSIAAHEIPDPSSSVPLPSLEEPGDGEALVKEAMEKRPEVSAVKAMIAAAFARVKSARGAFLPKVAATGQVEWDSEDLGEISDSWMVGLQASLPLFEGGVTVARMREAKARLREMEAKGEEVALDIALEVRQAFLAVQEASQKIRVQDERRKWALQALEEIRHQYRNEVAGVDSLLQAQNAWLQAEVAYNAAVFEGKTAQALLRRSIGDFAEGVL